MAGKSVKLSTTSFRDTPICELCLEDALKAGSAKSEKLKPQDFKETSVRFCVDGLYKWLKAYARKYGTTSVFGMIRDLSWYWASFCSTDSTMVGLAKEYDSLLDDLAEKTAFTDLAERMDEPLRVEKIGRAGRHFTVLVPASPHSVIQDCASALGTSFSVFFQLGLAKALISNRQGLYSSWATEKFVPLFDEFMTRAKKRLEGLKEIRKVMEYRMEKDG